MGCEFQEGIRSTTEMEEKLERHKNAILATFVITEEDIKKEWS